MANHLERCVIGGGFTIFQSIKSLGFYAWQPGLNHSYIRDHAITRLDIEQRIDYEAKPPPAGSMEYLKKWCPIKFKNGFASRTYRNEYPYNPTQLVPYLVAVRDRHLRHDGVQFMFGDSVLKVLAKSMIDKSASTPEEKSYRYYAQKIPGTEIVSIDRKSDIPYITFLDKQHQFRIMMRAIEPTHTFLTDFTMYYHLQTMTLGDHSVLFWSRCHLLDEEENPVSLLFTSHPNVYHFQPSLEMISGGATSLYAGKKGQSGVNVSRVEEITLQKAMVSLGATTRAMYEKNILNNLDALREEAKKLNEGDLCELIFNDDGDDRTAKLQNVSFFPPGSVVDELLSPYK
jgi:hypothetical protein